MTNERHASQPEQTPPIPLAAWFLGPRAENATLWQELFDYIFQDYVHWRRNYFPTDPVVVDRVQRRSAEHAAWLDHLTSNLDAILNQLKQHFPFHSPRYIGHMLSEQTLPSVLGYFTGMLFNPNNVTAEAAPITVELELEVGRMVAAMLGFNPNRAWAHLTSGGTIANLEALWVARSVQFTPLMVQEYCGQRAIPFRIRRPNGDVAAITEVSARDLLALRPNEAIFMWRKLAQYLHEEHQWPVTIILDAINDHINHSEFNPAQVGLAAVLNRVGLQPVIFVSAAAHYSVVKAANLLGYGRQAVVSVPVDERFHIDMALLRRHVENVPPHQFIAAVIGIAGTTEEGAVDPLHQIHFLRDELERDHNRSFWFHVDAAWGGYIRSLFCGVDLEQMPRGSNLDAICDQYVRALRVEEHFSVEAGAHHKIKKALHIRWADRDIYAAYLAMADADSVTVDPHKLGFTPYPAGIVAFRNGLVTEHVAERAQYISDDAGGIKSIDQPAQIAAVGPYIVEGSKPGAAALCCWLAHKTIPLNEHGHGQIVRATILSAKKLFKLLANHRHMFEELHEELVGAGHSAHPFTFIPLFEPDTNIVCFVALPMAWSDDGRLTNMPVGIDNLNALNQAIYAATSLAADETHRARWAVQPFFVSRTRFEEAQYSAAAIAPVLRRIGVQSGDYRRAGLFVLRSTVMNPWYAAAEQSGVDYLLAFVHHLHRVTHTALADLHLPAVELKTGTGT